MLYRKNGEKLEFVDEIEFKLEKDLQNLIQYNIGEIFGLKFIATEFPIENFRMDTVAYKPESNAFVIIEYKRGKNESLVDQGYAYLQVLLKRKADFVLCYNESQNAAKRISDFDWSQTRIIFISPRFTDYQKNAATFEDMPFELYEITKYDNDMIFVDAIGKTTVKIGQMNSSATQSKMPESVKVVNKEIEIYTEDMHLAKATDSIKELYFKFKTAVTEWTGVKTVINKHYISFAVKSLFVGIIIQNKALKLIINLKKGELSDPQNLTDDLSNKGHWASGDYQISIDSDDNLEYVLSLVKQSYKKQK